MTILFAIQIQKINLKLDNIKHFQKLYPPDQFRTGHFFAHRHTQNILNFNTKNNTNHNTNKND